MARTLLRFFASRRATAAIEFAIVVPVMLTFMAGLVELGHAFQTYRAVNQLASRYAITYADCSDTGGACNTLLATYGSQIAMQNLVPQLDATKINLRMFQVQMSGTTPQITYAWPTGTTTLTAIEQTAVANSIPTAQQNMVQVAVVVTISYPYQFAFFQALVKPFWPTPPTFSFTVAQDKS